MYKNLYQQRSIDKINIDKSFIKMMERAVEAKELLMKGIIDEEDYLSIKSDCENKISVFGKLLNDAYILDIQHKKIIKKLTGYFINPALIFKTTNNLTQYKTVSLFLKEGLCLSFRKTNIIDDIKCEAQIIYGFSYPGTKWLSYETGKVDNPTIEQEELLARVMKIEKKGYKMPPQDALKVLLFLSELAKVYLSAEKSNRIGCNQIGSNPAKVVH